jgi:hypothetical protein
VLVAVGRVFDQILLSELKALGDAPSGFFHRLAFQPMTLSTIHDPFANRS